MKKKSLKLLIISILFMMIFILTGCSNDEITENEQVIDEQTQSIEQENPETINGRVDTVEEKEYEELFAKKDDTTGLYGFVDKNDNWKIDPKYIKAYDFVKGYACVYDDAGCSIINSKDEIQFTKNGWKYTEQQGLNVCSNGNLILAHNVKVQYLDLKGNPVTEAKYNINSLSDFDENNLLMVKDYESGNYGLINEKGEEVIPCEYKYMRYDEEEKLYLVNKDQPNVFSGAPYYINENNEKVKDW